MESKREKALQANRVRWDELVAPHVTADAYGVDRLRRGERALHPIEASEIGDVAGLSILHLQCHFGVDSLILAQQGASVTGIDFAPEAIRTARGLAAELDLGVTFVEGDLYAAPELIEGPFDMVYTTWGTICWLPDLAGWARIAAGFLKPGGRFYFADCHPVAYIWCENSAADLPLGTFKARYPYFHDPEPMEEVNDGDYASDYKTRNTLSYEWAHPVGEIVTEVSRAGLVFEFMHEHDEIAWDLLPFLVPTSGGQYGWPKDMHPKLPLSLSFMARKPE